MKRRSLRHLLAAMIGAVAISALTSLAPVAGGPQAPAPRQTPPRPVRNDTPHPGRELAVLRNHQLRKGGHQPFFEFSRDGLWPYFDRIGARVVGQWKVIEPASTSADREDVYRMTRYASFEHWLGTRSGNGNPIGGDGPAWQKGQAGITDRRALETGSAGAYFLEGAMAPDGPYFMPALPERFRLVESGRRPQSTQPVIAVRAGEAQPAREIVELRYQRIRKGTFDEFTQATTTSVWPWEEKLGARPIGQWRVVYPQDPRDGSTRNAFGQSALRFITTPSAEYDEVVTLTRYSGPAHREALSAPDRAVFEGGNGPDFVAWKNALERQRSLTLTSRSEVLEGFMYSSPPLYLPGLPERYEPLP